MPSRFLIVSEREEDLRLGEFMAFANDLEARQVVGSDELGSLLIDAPESLVLWDAGDTRRSEEVSSFLAAMAKPRRVFAVTDRPLYECPHLAGCAVFGHHLLRRYGDPAPNLYARLALAALRDVPFGLGRYFPEEPSIRKILLKRSGQKGAAVKAVENFFIAQKVNTRISALVAQAVDELLMNAIFDAPVLPNGMPLRRGTDRASDFELIEQEFVLLEVASNDEYVGVCVADQFGSLKRQTLLEFITKDYQDHVYVAREKDPGAGLGLHGLVHSGLSMMYACKPGSRTEVMIFFAKDATYKRFRGGFRFLSLMMP